MSKLITTKVQQKVRYKYRQKNANRGFQSNEQQQIQNQKKQKKQKLRNQDQQQKYSQPRGLESANNSNYPSSLQSSKIHKRINQSMSSEQPIKRIRKLSQMSAYHQQIVNEYLQKVQNYNMKQLFREREELLEELQSINNHLNEMIVKLYGNIDEIEGENGEEGDKNNRLSKAGNFQKILEEEIEETIQQPGDTNAKNTISKKSNTINRNQSITSTIMQNSNVVSPPQFSSIQVQSNSQAQLQKISQRNQKAIKSLTQQLADYQFMLTGQYVQKLQQQVLNSQQIKRQLNYQVVQLNKQIKKHTRLYDKQQLQKLQKQEYNNQIQITLLTKKLQSKLTKYNTINKEIKEKQKKIEKLAYQQEDLQRLVGMYEDEEFENDKDLVNKKENYEKLRVRKEKLGKIINSYNNNHLKLYNRKLVDFRDLDNRIAGLEEQIQKMEYNLVLLVRERKEFQEQNKHILGKEKKKAQSLVEVRKSSLPQQLPSKYNKRTSESREKDNEFLQSRAIKSRNSGLQKNLMPKTKVVQYLSDSMNRQSTQSKKIQDKGYRKRVYTQLENSHYFSSMQKKKYNVNNIKKRIYTLQNNQDQTQIPYDSQQQDEVKPQQKIVSQNKINQSQPVGIGKIKKQSSKQLPGMKSDSQAKKKLLTSSLDKNSQRQSDNQKDVDKRLAKLQRLLSLQNENEITLNPKSNTKQGNYSFVGSDIASDKLNYLNSGSKLKNPIQSQASNKLPSSSVSISKLKNGSGSFSSGLQTPLASQLSYQNKIRSRTKMTQNQKKSKQYYKQLCDRLGKQKLLIEEDEDISDLIYQGIGGNDSNTKIKKF